MLLYSAEMDTGRLSVPSLSDHDIWRWFVAPFLHGDKLGYAFVALVAVGIFGTLLERRFGAIAAVATFILAGGAGAALAVVLETPPLLSDAPDWQVMGANGAALGLLCAWFVDDRLAARRGHDRENDLMGVYVIAAVLVVLSLTTEEANIAAAVGGALAGTLLGLVMPRLTRKAGARARRGRLVRSGASVGGTLGGRRAGRGHPRHPHRDAAGGGDPHGHADRRGRGVGTRT
jgi:membrane associated rhomboid family serine protease